MGSAIGARILDKVGQMVGRPLQSLHDFRVNRDPVTAHFVQHRFKPVGKGHQRRQLERPGTALDGMDGPEHRIDGVIVMGTGIHPRQPLGQRLQQFFAFLKEHIADRGLHAHLTPSLR